MLNLLINGEDIKIARVSIRTKSPHAFYQTNYKYISNGLFQLLQQTTPVISSLPFLITNMKGTTQASEPLYPSISPHMPEEAGLPSTSAQDVEKQQYSAPSSSSSLQLPSDTESNEKYWGTHVMGIPAVPTCHPDNKKAALWGAATDSAAAEPHHHPYLQYTPVDKPSSSPMESILQKFNSWSKKTETMAHNIWHNRMSMLHVHIYFYFLLLIWGWNFNSHFRF